MQELGGQRTLTHAVHFRRLWFGLGDRLVLQPWCRPPSQARHSNVLPSFSTSRRAQGLGSAHVNVLEPRCTRGARAPRGAGWVVSSRNAMALGLGARG